MGLMSCTDREESKFLHISKGPKVEGEVLKVRKNNILLKKRGGGRKMKQQDGTDFVKKMR